MGENNGNYREPLTYHDFPLRLTNDQQIDGNFRVWVEGAMKPEEALSRHYEPHAFWRDPVLRQGGLLGDLERRRLKEEEKLFKLGYMLADLVLPSGGVRELLHQKMAALQSGEGLRIRLYIDSPELALLPWEFMASPQTSGEAMPSDFFGLRREISIVRTDTVGTTSPQLPTRDRMRIVAVLSNPDDQDEINVAGDKTVIQKAIAANNKAAGQEALEAFFVEKPATLLAMEQALTDGAEIFYFAGHALYDRLEQEGKIVLEKDDYSSDYYNSTKLAQMLRNADVRCAILAACETGSRDQQKIWAGIASALSREKLPAVLAHQFRIEDDSTILIANRVCHRLLQGYTIDELLYEARAAIYQQKGLLQRDWGTPVLYLHDKNGILFPPPDTATSLLASSPFIHVMNTFRQISGTVIDVNIASLTVDTQNSPGTVISVNNEIEHIKKGATYQSVKIDKIDMRSNTKKQRR